MLSLFSTLGGLLISGLPKLLDYFQNKADQAHELRLAQVQTERELQLAAAGFAAQAKVEEIRTEQVSMQAEAQMTEAALKHDEKVLERASTWVVNYIGTVRPTVTYIFILELCLINAWVARYVQTHPELITSIEDLVRLSDVIFSTDEMAMLGAIVGFWFGSRSWSKK
jgi:hypothetical protein